MSFLPVKVLFFDVGGTLLRPSQPVGETYAELAARYGAVLDPFRVEQGFRSSFKALRNRPAGTIPRNGDDRAWWREVVRMSLNGSVLPMDFRFDDFFEALYITYEQSDRWVLYPEVEETLEKLHNHGFRLAIISNWDSRLRRILEGQFLTAFFSEIFISGELGVAKPQTGIYDRALKTMGCEAGEALMIGDDEENDDQAPRRLGWKTFLVNRPVTDLGKILDQLMIDRKGL